MPEPLIIVGAGGHGRETALAHVLRSGEGLFLGFLDDRAAGPTPEAWPVIGRVDSAAEHARAEFLIAINDPRIRRAVATRLAGLGVTRWATVVHPDVRLHRTVRRGRGCSILGGCHLTTNIDLGDHCILNRGCQVSHDCSIGDFCSLNPGACVAGSVSIGDGCEVGSACAIRQGSRIGRGATLGMGSVIVADVADNAVMVGCPGRLLRSQSPW